MGNDLMTLSNITQSMKKKGKRKQEQGHKGAAGGGSQETFGPIL